jgi:hypothetical protein
MRIRTFKSGTSTQWRSLTVATKVLQLAAGMSLAWICLAQSAYALNGFTNISACTNCQTSADFISAANTQAISMGGPGLYVVMSSNYTKTAYISVTGTIKTVYIQGLPEQVFRNPVGTPVDVSGNSLSSFSEGSLEAEFEGIDQTQFGTNRGSSIGIVQCPSNYEASFVGSDLEALSAEISGFINQQYNITQIPVGTTVTVQFADLTKATFTKVYYMSQPTWTWTGYAWDAHGNLIDHSGNLILNRNTSGGGGGSSHATNGGGYYQLDNGNLCQTETTVTWGGLVLSYNFHYLPC